MTKHLTWAVGLTTFLGRKATTLPQTLTSLARAGWESPVVFVDGGSPTDWSDFILPIRVRPKTHAYGNWWLGMQELYVSNPTADRYMMVQDDVLFVANLRDYLDAVRWPGRGYLNLYTSQNQVVTKPSGFFRANMNKRGLGALALVFDQESIVELLASRHMIEKFRPKKHLWEGRKAIDGGVGEAMNQAGMSEWCHSRSLVQHTGSGCSTLGNIGKSNAPSFPGEDFNARELLVK